jgi:hypothetical protein
VSRYINTLESIHLVKFFGKFFELNL